MFLNVQVQNSPSFIAMLTVAVPGVYEPPLGLATKHETESKPQFVGMGVSLIVYVVKVVMFGNSLVLAVVPSSTREKLVNGNGDAVNPNGVGPSGIASLMIVMDPGKITAPAERDLSWLPPDPSRAIFLMWYGEPEIVTAELVFPQSCREEIWPPQARTGLDTLAVNVIAILADLSPANPVPFGYVYALTLVIVPPYRVKTPGI